MQEHVSNKLVRPEEVGLKIMQSQEIFQVYSEGRLKGNGGKKKQSIDNQQIFYNRGKEAETSRAILL